MNTNGWEQLDCRYFAETCREVVSDYLKAHGFVENGLTPGGGIIYKRSDLFLELNYDAIRYPKYDFTGGVVIGDEYPNKQGGFSFVPLWYLVPSDHLYRSQGGWMFSSKDELAKVLAKVKTEFLETILVPLFLNRDRLEHVIDSFHSK